jgi:hemerythrin-like metal-binding protein
VGIDAQHQGLVRLINGLHGAMAAGHGKDAVGKILDEPVRYTQSHLTFEENLLRQRGYSKLAAH